MASISVSTGSRRRSVLVTPGSLRQPLSLQLARLALCLALGVVLLGGWTRLNDAGLSCPDWPGCYGELILPASAGDQALAQSRYPQQPLDLSRSWIEMSHRYLAATLGLVVATLAFIGWRQRRQSDYPSVLSAALLLLVILQALFGMWTVTLKLMPQVVTLHLLGGLLTVTLLCRLQQRLGVSADASPNLRHRSCRRGIGVAVLLLLLQVGLGGWTSANYAGWACSHWLTCEQELIQTLDFDAGFSLATVDGRNYQGGQLSRPARAAIQMTHRGAAVLLTLYLLGLSVLLFRRPPLRRATGCLLILLSLQLLLGGLNVRFGLPLGLAFAHHIGAVLLLVTLLWLYGHSGAIEGAIKESDHG